MRRQDFSLRFLFLRPRIREVHQQRLAFPTPRGVLLVREEGVGDDGRHFGEVKEEGVIDVPATRKERDASKLAKREEERERGDEDEER